MQEYLSSSLTAIIMRSQIMPPKLIEQMALWKKVPYGNHDRGQVIIIG